MERLRLVLLRPVGQKIFWLAVAVLVLNVIDAYFSLYLVHLGERELNPLHHHLMSVGTDHFLGWKVFVAATCVVLLATLEQRRSARLIMWFSFVLYLVNGLYLTVSAVLIYQYTVH